MDNDPKTQKRVGDRTYSPILAHLYRAAVSDTSPVTCPTYSPLLPRILCGRRQFRDFEPREKRIDEAHVGNAPHERPRSQCLAPTGAIVVISLRAAYFVGKSSAKDRHVVAPAEEVQMCEGSVTRIRAHSIASIAFEYSKPRL